MFVSFLFLLGPVLVYAGSPWDVACHYGHCSHTIQESSGRSVAHGQINLVSSPSSAHCIHLSGTDSNECYSWALTLRYQTLAP